MFPSPASHLRRVARFACVGGIAVAAVACSSSSGTNTVPGLTSATGPATFKGSFSPLAGKQMSFEGLHAFALGVTSGSSLEVDVYITDNPSFDCNAAINDHLSFSGGFYRPGGTNSLVLSFQADGTTVYKGHYAGFDEIKGPGGEGSSDLESAVLVSTDKGCGGGTDLTATHFSVTLTSVSHDSIGGSGTVTFGSGDSVAGSFTAPICNLTATQEVMNGTVCNP